MRERIIVKYKYNYRYKKFHHITYKDEIGYIYTNLYHKVFNIYKYFYTYHLKTVKGNLIEVKFNYLESKDVRGYTQLI